MWPNGDNDFNKILVKIFGENGDSPENRKFVFYAICIWVRLILYVSLFYLVKYDISIYLLLLFSIIAIWNLTGNLNGNQWWSKKWQLFISICLFILCIMCLYYKDINRNIIPILLLISLLGGIIQSLRNL
jgi:hypothetical protein